MRSQLIEEFEDCPVIAAIKDEEGLKRCIHSDIPIVFVLYGDICNISQIVSRLKKAGKRNKKYICKENTIICNGDNNICNG